MTSGKVTTLRASKDSDKPEPTWQLRIGRNATEQDETEARAKLVGRTFTVDGGRKYKIVKVYRDEINRLIALGVYIEEQKGQEA